MVYGTGTSFGQMVAGHWASSHGANTSGSASALAARATVKKYYKLFQLLISDENPHPEDMNLYIYSSLTSPLDLSGNDHDGVYQNLLAAKSNFEAFFKNGDVATQIRNHGTDLSHSNAEFIRKNMKGIYDAICGYITAFDKKDVKTCCRYAESGQSY